jgi:hypothetical protein
VPLKIDLLRKVRSRLENDQGNALSVVAGGWP